MMMMLSLTIVIPNFKADIATVKYTGTGNLFPEENCSLIMTNASVIFNIDYKEQFNRIDISFKGNYTIYNPDVTQNITLAAPFSPAFKNLESTCVIKIDDIIKTFKFILTIYQNNSWFYLLIRKLKSGNNHLMSFFYC